MESIFEKITEAVKEFLISLIENNLGTMFDDVNEKVSEIASEVAKTPKAWNEDIFSVMQSLSENVILPIAGLIITFVLCYELISMITEKNNMHDIDTFIFFKYIFKSCAAVLILSHTTEIIMGIFELGGYVVQNSAGVISGDTGIDLPSAAESIRTSLEAMGIGELVMLAIETALVSLSMKLLSVCITVVIFGRMIEIYLYASIGAIPFATLANKEWGQIGSNYLRGLAALSFQGFFIMACVGIYAALVSSLPNETNLHSSIFAIAAYTVCLCFALFQTGRISKLVFNVH